MLFISNEISLMQEALTEERKKTLIRQLVQFFKFTKRLL